MPRMIDTDYMMKPQASRFERLGGREVLAGIVRNFYERVERDPELRPIFPADLGLGRDKQLAFLEQWLGGEPCYTQRYGEPALRLRHQPFAITERGAKRWLKHFEAALKECAVDEDLVSEILEGLEPIAQRMVNRSDVGTEIGSLNDSV